MRADAIPLGEEDCSSEQSDTCRTVQYINDVEFHQPLDGSYCPEPPRLKPSRVESRTGECLGLVCTSATKPSTELLLPPDEAFYHAP